MVTHQNCIRDITKLLPAHLALLRTGPAPCRARHQSPTPPRLPPTRLPGHASPLNTGSSQSRVWLEPEAPVSTCRRTGSSTRSARIGMPARTIQPCWNGPSPPAWTWPLGSAAGRSRYRPSAPEPSAGRRRRWPAPRSARPGAFKPTPTLGARTMGDWSSSASS